MNRYLTEPEQRRLLAALKEVPAEDLLARRDAAVVRALMTSGCRIGEFSRVTLGQALESLRSGYLFIPKEHRKGKLRDHSVYLTGELRRAIKDLLAVRAEMVSGAFSESDPLVIGRRGEALSVRSFQARMKRWAIYAALPYAFSPHWLRHTLGQNLVRHSQAKNPLGIVQARLGHASLSSTGIYTSVTREDVVHALEESESHFAPRGRVTKAQLRRAYEARETA